jgi:hypothetical protein
MKSFIVNKILFLSVLTLFMNYALIVAQNVIKPGEISGVWSKKSSPYLIKGDLNIPSGKTLVIQSGVAVKFDGLYTINVQGSLIADGTDKDSIIFTVSDTAGIKKRNRLGWNGIRFDRRPVTWDTLKFRMPEDEELKKIIESRIKNKEMDTATKINLALKIPDAVYDNVVHDSIFISKQGSRISYCRFEYATSEGKGQPYVFGGAIYIYRYSNLLISNCLFENNAAWAGGAIYCKEAAPVIMNNKMVKCSAQSSGGAMVFVHSGPIIMNNVIHENVSGYNGGAVLFYESSPYVLNNTFLRNRAENSGGALYIEQKENAFPGTVKYKPVATVKFPRNPAFDKANLNKSSSGNTTSYYGRYINNIVGYNKAVTGGGISLFATMPEFNSLTLSDNMADTAGGGIYCNVSAPRLVNSILYGNSKDQVYLIGECRPAFQYCSIESGTSGIIKDSTCKVSFDYSDINNLPPKFKGPGYGDYSLTEGSGCIDAGIPDTASLRLPSVDLSGKNRIVNSRIDIGALEYVGKKNTLKNTEGSDIVNPNANGTVEEMYTSIFPNPTSGCFSIVIHNNKYESLTVRIFTRTGQEIYINNFKTGTWFEKQINLDGYSHGVYIVMIESDYELLYNGEIILK